MSGDRFWPEPDWHAKGLPTIEELRAENARRSAQLVYRVFGRGPGTLRSQIETILEREGGGSSCDGGIHEVLYPPKPGETVKCFRCGSDLTAAP